MNIKAIIEKIAEIENISYEEAEKIFDSVWFENK